MQFVKVGDWAGVLNYEKVQLLPAEGKRSTLEVVDVQSVGKKRKLLLTEDGSVFKVKRSKLEDTVEAGQII